MKRTLLRTSYFIRAARKTLKKHPELAADLESALQLLEADSFHPRLKIHKLTGPLKGCWACSAGYNLRIVFRFVPYERGEAILLATLGTHDEVY